MQRSPPWPRPASRRPQEAASLPADDSPVAEEIEHSKFFMRERLGHLSNFGIDRDEIIRPRNDPFGTDGGLAILRGNIAPDGAMVKSFSVPKEMHVHTGPARVFEDEPDAIDALIERRISQAT